MKFPTFDKKADVPAAFADLYHEVEGKWVAKDDDGDDLADKLKDERKTREASEKLVKKLQGELDKAKRELDKLDRTTDGVTAEQRAKIVADARKDFDAEVADKLSAAEMHAKENRALKLDHQMKKLALESKLLPTRADDWWKLHGDEFDLNDDGKPMVKGKPSSSVKAAVEASLKARPEWVEGTRANGGGGQGGGPGVGTGTMSFEDAVKNPKALLDLANAGGKK